MPRQVPVHVPGGDGMHELPKRTPPTELPNDIFAAGDKSCKDPSALTVAPPSESAALAPTHRSTGWSAAS